MNKLTAFCGIHRGQFYFCHKLCPVSLSHRHLLLDLFRHINQAKSVEQSINVRHTPDISQSLGSVHYLSDFTDIVIRQHHRAPCKALAVLSAVDPQFLGEFISPALLQLIYKDTNGKRTLPQALFCLPRTPRTIYVAYQKEALGSFEPRASAVAGHFIKIFEQKSSIANRNPYSGFALSAMMESRYWRGVKPVCLRNTR